jgi:hypothetical protein
MQALVTLLLAASTAFAAEEPHDIVVYGGSSG